MRGVLLVCLASCAGAPHVTESAGVVEVGATQLFVREIGAGTPVVVIHGGPILDHGYLFEPLAPLADEYRLIFYDQRLSGRTPILDSDPPLSLDALIEDIDALRARDGSSKVSIIAHSWGGLLGGLYAARYPGRVERLVLVGPMAASPVARGDESAAEGAKLTDEHKAELARVRSLPEVRERTPAGVELMLRTTFRSQFHDPKLADSLAFHIGEDYAERSKRFQRVGPEVFPRDFSPEIARITAPTLVIYGEHEAGASIGGQRYATAIPNAELDVVRDAGHFPFVERPDAFLGRVRAFLRGRD